MFTIDSDNNISVTRGDVIYFGVSAEDPETKELYMFQPGDVVRINVYGKKDCKNVVLEKDFAVTSACEEVEIFLEEADTKIGETINRPVDYWYEIVLNPDVKPQTIIGYFEEGATIFRLYPEGEDITSEGEEIKPEDIPIIDDELDLLSERPVKNRAVAAAVLAFSEEINKLNNEVALLKAEKEESESLSEQEGESV